MRWILEDSRGTAPARVGQAMTRAASEAWAAEAFLPSMGTRTADLRWLVAATLRACADLSVKPPALGAAEIPDGFAAGFSSPEREEVARALSNTCAVLAMGLPGVPETGKGFRTTDGGGPVEAEGAPLAVLAVVLATTAWTVAAGAVVYYGSQVIDRHLSRTEESRRMVQRHAQMVAEVEKHAAAERAAGKPLPLSEPQKVLLETLKESQVEAAKKAEAPIAPPVDISGIAKDAAPWIAAAVVALVLLKS